MQRQSWRQTLIFSLLLTAGWGAVTLAFSDSGSVFEALALSPLFFVVIFLTMRATNWATVVIAERFAGKPERRDTRHEPVQPSSARPEHAQRRRRRVRRRRNRR